MQYVYMRNKASRDIHIAAKIDDGALEVGPVVSWELARSVDATTLAEGLGGMIHDDWEEVPFYRQMEWEPLGASESIFAVMQESTVPSSGRLGSALLVMPVALYTEQAQAERYAQHLAELFKTPAKAEAMRTLGITHSFYVREALLNEPREF